MGIVVVVMSILDIVVWIYFMLAINVTHHDLTSKSQAIDPPLKVGEQSTKCTKQTF
jgi:hypothetical protein